MSSKNVLAALGESDQYITLAVTLAGELVPVGKALLRDIRTIGAGTETVSYQLLLEADSKELDAIAALSLADLAAINGELAKLGKPPIVPIAAPPPTPITQAKVPSPAGSAAAAQATAATSAAHSGAADSGSAPAPAGAVTEVPAGGNSAVVGATGDHGAIGDLGTNTPAVKSS